MISAVASAMPSMIPTASTLAPRPDTRKIGSRLWISSDERSMNRLTRPSIQTVRGMVRRSSMPGTGFSGFIWLPSGFEDRDRFDVRRMREHIDRACGLQCPSTHMVQHPGIARQGGRVARHVDDAARPRRVPDCRLSFVHGSCAFARRIDPHTHDTYPV